MEVSVATEKDRLCAWPHSWMGRNGFFLFGWCLLCFCLGSVSTQAQPYVKVTTEITSYSGNTSYKWSATCVVGTNAWHSHVHFNLRRSSHFGFLFEPQLN
jgi:hypothetical protein